MPEQDRAEKSAAWQTVIGLQAVGVCNRHPCPKCSGGISKVQKLHFGLHLERIGRPSDDRRESHDNTERPCLGDRKIRTHDQNPNSSASGKRISPPYQRKM